MLVSIYLRTVGCVLLICSITLGNPSEELLAAGFFSDSVGRYDPDTTEFLGLLDPTAGLNGALGITVGPDENIYVCSELTNRVLRYSGSTGDFLDVFVEPGNGLNGPSAVAFGPDFTKDGIDELYVASFNSDSILRYNGETGAFIDVFVSSGSGGLNGPDAGCVFGTDGNLYVPSFWSNAVLRYSGEDGSWMGSFITPGSVGLTWPRTVVFRPSDGNILVTGESSNKVFIFNSATGASMGALVNFIAEPTGMAIGSDGHLYVASLGNNAVYKYNIETGALLGTVIEPGSGGLSGVTYIQFISPISQVPGDLNGDGVVSTTDLLILLSSWGPCDICDKPEGCPADFDENCAVGTSDLLLLLSNWG